LPDPERLHIYSSRVPRQLIHLVCFPFSLLYRLDILHDFVENLTSGCMEAFMLASNFFSWLELCLSRFRVFLWDFCVWLDSSILKHLCSVLLVRNIDRCLVHLCA
jgi:hypothetical protein